MKFDITLTNDRKTEKAAKIINAYNGWKDGLTKEQAENALATAKEFRRRVLAYIRKPHRPTDKATFYGLTESKAFVDFLFYAKVFVKNHKDKDTNCNWTRNAHNKESPIVYSELLEDLEKITDAN